MLDVLHAPQLLRPGLPCGLLPPAQEAFFEGHVLALAHFNGVPALIRYDNLKAAVAKILFGRDRTENERFVTLRSHYGFDSFYCRPGIEGSHEKGGVEGEVGRFRRRHLVPVPNVADMAELNELLAAGDVIDDDRHIARRPVTVGQAAAVEAPSLRARPEEPFDSCALLSAKVDTKGRICVRQSFYSVPVGLARRDVAVRLGAQSFEVMADGNVVATHLRSLHKGTEDLVLDHYLEILARKPGAMPGSTALVQARASGVFGPAHERFWAEARHQLGDGAGTRALIGVLLLQRRMPARIVTAAMEAALGIGSVDPEVVAIEARRLEQRPPAPVIPIGAAAGEKRPPRASAATTSCWPGPASERHDEHVGDRRDGNDSDGNDSDGNQSDGDGGGHDRSGSRGCHRLGVPKPAPAHRARRGARPDAPGLPG